jgi:hypothetical protein
MKQDPTTYLAKHSRVHWNRVGNNKVQMHTWLLSMTMRLASMMKHGEETNSSNIETTQESMHLGY